MRLDDALVVLRAVQAQRVAQRCQALALDANQPPTGSQWALEQRELDSLAGAFYQATVDGYQGVEAGPKRWQALFLALFLALLLALFLALAERQAEPAGGLHAEHSAAGLRVNSVCPGWVRTALGGPQATLSVEEGARGVVWAATLGPEGPSGGFWRDGVTVVS